MVSVEGLCRLIDSRQLTSELGGSLSYDHEEWIELRLAFEEFIWDASDVLQKLYSIQTELKSEDFAKTQDEAKVCDLHYTLSLL